MASDGQKRLLSLVKRVRAVPGWEVEISGNTHWKFIAPNGRCYFTGTSPGDVRSLRNAVAGLRRMGQGLDNLQF